MNSDIQETPSKRITYESITGPQEVYDAFKELIEHPSRGALTSPKKPYHKPGDTFTFKDGIHSYPVSETHHQRTSFTSNQEHYLDIVRATLQNNVVAVEDGLVSRFTKAWNPHENTVADFEGILVKEYLNCINAAFYQTPNLIPAYYAFLISTGAGADGLMLAAQEGFHPRRIDINKDMGENYSAFVGVRVDEKTGKIESEIQCKAPVQAIKSIIEIQKCVAVANLQVNQDDLTTFAGSIPDIMFSIRDSLTEKMNSLGYYPPKKQITIPHPK